MMYVCTYALGKVTQQNVHISNPDVIQIYSGITSGKVLDGELLYT